MQIKIDGVGKKRVNTAPIKAFRRERKDFPVEKVTAQRNSAPYFVTLLLSTEGD